MAKKNTPSNGIKYTTHLSPKSNPMHSKAVSNPTVKHKRFNTGSKTYCGTSTIKSTAQSPVINNVAITPPSSRITQITLAKNERTD
ncbi:hypothetical protein TUM4438_42590 [Shewanella sairae]|uniref:Uncharacterized protein n=1 Tax=Shewanella sairae TaxID=190310 RepID=A0ABQ4PQY6_9GAMM|nr:hypothetical protein TUM4438_42590 [Shewanella sairae]